MSNSFVGEVVEILSGDDLIVMVDLGVENLHRKTRVRLLGVDTPNALDTSQGDHAAEIRREVQTMVRGKKVRLEVSARNNSSWVAEVYVKQSGQDLHLNALLRERGYVFKRGAKQ